MYRAGSAYFREFTTQRFDTGAATNADSLPSATASRNGTDDSGFVLTVANVATGRYKITGTVPDYAPGDVVSISVAATVNSVAGKGVVDTFMIEDTMPALDLYGIYSVTVTTTSQTLAQLIGTSLPTDLREVVLVPRDTGVRVAYGSAADNTSALLQAGPITIKCGQDTGNLMQFVAVPTYANSTAKMTVLLYSPASAADYEESSSSSHSISESSLSSLSSSSSSSSSTSSPSSNSSSKSSFSSPSTTSQSSVSESTTSQSSPSTSSPSTDSTASTTSVSSSSSSSTLASLTTTSGSSSSSSTVASLSTTSQSTTSQSSPSSNSSSSPSSSRSSLSTSSTAVSETTAQMELSTSSSSSSSSSSTAQSVTSSSSSSSSSTEVSLTSPG